MAVDLVGPDLGFARLVDALRARALEGGVELSPRDAYLQLSAAIARAIERAPASGVHGRRQYVLELVVSPGDGRPPTSADYERVGQWWEALGGVWLGRVTGAARGMFMWQPGA